MAEPYTPKPKHHGAPPPLAQYLTDYGLRHVEDSYFHENLFHESLSIDEDFPDILVRSCSSRSVGAGIVNLINTCYMAAILQCLTHTGPLFRALRYSDHNTPCHESGFCVICAFRDHNDEAIELSRCPIYPSTFLENVKYFSAAFIPYILGDAHEFMICALNKLQDAFPEGQNNPIDQIFGGRTITKLRCCSCGFSSDTIVPILDLRLAVENLSTVQRALESYFMIENMDAKFKCSSCDQQVYMAKQLLIDKAPGIAVLQLKRFKCDGEKIESHVSFAMDLDLEPYTSPKCREHDAILMYDLYAVVVHRGSTAKSGHYFSYVRSDENTWHLMDDSEVCRVSIDEVLSQQAYLLFYAKHGTPWFSSVETEERDLKPEGFW
ncbi:ubiquitin carboxyl-terminal hydrolase 20-like [Vicia villosa]|uniref:ubiquitin carboxyl-terminal hydrolase 20-like n=1 Tax=Vicia villosa TaxID=3911 RepID=UPI00273B0821|nr:ubiquitin carboxyl-terminal hydrolase 20-like [Vicia villosa]